MLTINQFLQQGRYQITNRLEYEETVTTYQAFDNVLKTNVIIKETSFDSKSSSPSYKYPVAGQIENLTSIKHATFSQIYGFFSETDRQYLVTEIIEGQNLRQVLEKNKPVFPLFTVLKWTEQLTEALNFLHSRVPPVIHRNINPSSLFLNSNNQIKLLTDNLIKEFSHSQKTGKSPENFQLPYLPLEIIWRTLDHASQKFILNGYDEKSIEVLESPIDERSDIYSLGATIYHLITGRAPTDVLERSIELLEDKEDPLVSPNHLNKQIPRNFSIFLTKALEIRRENRFQTVSQMKAALQPMLDLMRKAEQEIRKEANDPKVIESALREVELARQALKKQKETERESQKIKEEPLPPVPLKTAQTISDVSEKLPLQPARVNTSPEALPTEVNRESALLAAEKDQEIVLAEAATILEKETIIPSRQTETIADLPEETFAANDEEDNEVFSSFQTERKSSFPLIPAICFALILVIGGFAGYKFLGSKSPENMSLPPAEQNLSKDAVQTPPQPVASTDNPAVTSTATTGNEEQNAPPAPVLETQLQDAESKTRKSQTAASKTEKKTVAKTPLPKKKQITVDDIINDN